MFYPGTCVTPCNGVSGTFIIAIDQVDCCAQHPAAPAVRTTPRNAGTPAAAPDSGTRCFCARRRAEVQWASVRARCCCGLVPGGPKDGKWNGGGLCTCSPAGLQRAAPQRGLDLQSRAPHLARRARWSSQSTTRRPAPATRAVVYAPPARSASTAAAPPAGGGVSAPLTSSTSIALAAVR
jgi:hypothetical protein